MEGHLGCKICFHEISETLSCGDECDCKYCSKYHIKIYNISDPCFICYTHTISKTTPGYILQCGHWLCITCLLSIKTECPFCKMPIDHTKIEFIGGSQIFIKLPSQTITIHVDSSSMNGLQLRQLVSLFLYNIYYPSAKLIYGGRMIADDMKLDSHIIPIQSCSTLHFINRMCGD